MKKRKANNPQKRLALIGRKVLKDKLVVFVQGVTKHAVLVDRKTLRVRNPTETEATLIARNAWFWAFELSVLCRDQSGEEYVTSEPMFCQSAYKQGTKELIDLLNKEHARFANTCNRLHMVTLAWVAAPVHDGEEIMSPKELHDLYDSMGAFEFLSHWENEQRKKEAA